MIRESRERPAQDIAQRERKSLKQITKYPCRTATARWRFGRLLPSLQVGTVVGTTMQSCGRLEKTSSYDLNLRIPVLSTRSRFLASTNPNSSPLCHCPHSDVACPNSRTAGRRRSLNYEDINYIKSHCRLHSSAFLDELQSDPRKLKDWTLYKVLWFTSVTDNPLRIHLSRRQ